MGVDIVFGVDTLSIDEAKSWIEAATNLMLELSYSDHRGGEYYSAETAAGDILKLMVNRGVQDDETIVDGADDWEIVLALFVPNESSDMLAGLSREPDKFHKACQSGN